MPVKNNQYTQIIKELTKYFDVEDESREVPVNMTLTSEGFLQKDYGVDDTLETFSALPTWIKNFKKKDGSQYTLVSSGTSLYLCYFTKNKAYPIPSARTVKTGTVAVTKGSTAIVGTGTLFTTEFVAGNVMMIGTELCKIITITDNTHIVLDAGIEQNTGSGLAVYTTVAATFTTGGEFGAVVYNDKLYLGNAIDSYAEYDGLTITSYASLPKGNIYEVFEDRVFVSGVRAEPLSIYYSDIAVPTTFNVSSVLKPLGSDSVTGLINYYGVLVILKQNTIWRMQFTYDQVVTLFVPKIESLNRNYGCIGIRAYAWVENDIWFFTGTEIRALGFKDQQTGVLGIDPSVISTNIKERLQQITATEATKIVMFYNNRKVYLSIPLSDKLDTVFVSHLLYSKAWTKIKARPKGYIRSIDTRDGAVYTASSNVNKVYKWNNKFSDAGVAISAYVIFKEYEDKDFSVTNVFRYIDVKFKNLFSRVRYDVWTDSFDIRSNRNKTAFVGTEAEGMENSLGEVPFGESLVGDSFGEDVVQSNFVKRRISMLQKGSIIAFGLANNTLNESFTICAFEITGFKRVRKYYSPGKIMSI